MIEKKQLYRRKIVKNLYFSSSLSCSDLSIKIKKSLPLATKMLNELIEDGVIVETGQAPSTGGRRPAMYSLRSDMLYIVAVALDQFVGRIVLLDMNNNYIAPVEKFELILQDNPDALEILAGRLESFMDRHGIPKEKIAGIGIGMPGFVDVKKGVNFTFLKTGDQSITAYISDRIGIPAYIDNDSSLIALAELRFGAAQEKQNAMVVNIGWGIGLGLILNGELFRGHNGFAGELSHIPLFSNGKLCSCGKSGCLETETSFIVLLEKAKAGLKEGRASRMKLLTVSNAEEASETIIAAACEGDRFAIELFSEAGYNIGRGLAILIHILNPEMIILSGRGSAAGRIWQAPIQQALNEHCIPRLSNATSIQISTLGYDAELIGAAALVMDNYEIITADNKETTADLYD